MLRAQHFGWLPNALTITRLVLAVPFGLAAVYEAWTFGLIIFAVALLTDFLDGLAAKKLNAYSAFGAALDPIADATLVGAGFTGLSAGGYFPWWGTLLLFLAALGMRSKTLLWPRPGRMAAVRSLISVASMLTGWAYLAWTYATLAYGWTWWYVGVTVMVLVVSGLLKRHRLRAWLARGQKP